jgi:hypothetical protein
MNLTPYRVKLFAGDLTKAANALVLLNDAQIKKSDRTDSESLGLADTIAKNVAKSFDKATESPTVQIASR